MDTDDELERQTLSPHPIVMAIERPAVRPIAHGRLWGASGFPTPRRTLPSRYLPYRALLIHALVCVVFCGALSDVAEKQEPPLV